MKKRISFGSRSSMSANSPKLKKKSRKRSASSKFDTDQGKIASKETVIDIDLQQQVENSSFVIKKETMELLKLTVAKNELQLGEMQLNSPGIRRTIALNHELDY